MTQQQQQKHKYIVIENDHIYEMKNINEIQ